MNFKARARAIQFSPDGKYFAITNEKTVNVWKAPGHTREFAPFVLYYTALGHHDAVTNINWSPDSKYYFKAYINLIDPDVFFFFFFFFFVDSLSPLPKI
jgi:periodic tryptophan protein 2